MAQYAREPGKYPQCSHCGTEAKIGDLYCWNCSSPVNECIKCSTANKAGDAHCFNCHSPITTCLKCGTVNDGIFINCWYCTAPLPKKQTVLVLVLNPPSNVPVPLQTAKSQQPQEQNELLKSIFKSSQ